MKKTVRFLLIFIILSSCDESKHNFYREVSIYNGITLKKTEYFEGTVMNDENLLIYKYISEKDSSKTISIKYDKSSKNLISATDEFKKISGRKIIELSLSQKSFSVYHSKNPSEDSTGPILFNDEYGLLAIENSFGPTIIFLKKEDKKLRNRILKTLGK